MIMYYMKQIRAQKERKEIKTETGRREMRKKENDKGNKITRK